MNMMPLALHFTETALIHSATDRKVTPLVAFRVARFAQVGVDDLLAGKLVPPGTCPHCGRGPTDDTVQGQPALVSGKSR